MMTNNYPILKIDEIRSRIYEVRGQKIMLDRDLAMLYSVETKYLNRQVKRNAERFPSDFMFQLSKDEFNEILKCQNVTSSDLSNWGGDRRLPHAFTEQGVAMLSGILRSQIAIQANINIMRAFVAARHAISTMLETNLHLSKLELKVERLNHYIEEILHDQNDINEDVAIQLDNINDAMAALLTDSTKNECKNSLPRVGFTAIQEKRNKEK